MNVKILAPFLIIIFLSAGCSTAYAVTHRISKEKLYKSSHVVKDKNIETPSADNSSVINSDVNFELGIGNRFIIMFINKYNAQKNRMGKSTETSLFGIQLSWGLRFLKHYKIDFRFGYDNVYEDFGGFNEGIFLQAGLFNTNIYGIAGIDFLNNSKTAHGTSTSGGNFVFTCLGLGYKETKNITLEIMYWIPNKKVFGADYVNEGYMVNKYDKIDNGLIEIGVQYSFIF